jgi:phage tail sheath protein FI
VLSAVPPCGYVAGIIARTDRLVGVQGAPANAVVEGVLDLDVALASDDQAQLNEIGVNCLRSLPGRGIRVWGARTLSRAPTWRYVPVRRLFLTLVRWFEQELRDVVFEPHSPYLWEHVRERLNTYCYSLFQGGALKGREPGEAFFVKCDAEINTSGSRERGQLIAEIGLAAVIPGEFIVVRMCRRPEGVTATQV